MPAPPPPEPTPHVQRLFITSGGVIAALMLALAVFVAKAAFDAIEKVREETAAAQETAEDARRWAAMGYADGVRPAYDTPITQPDQWLTSATADGGTPVSILAEVGQDAGLNPDIYRTFTITNDNSTCVNVGSDGSGDADPVNVNTGFELGTGAGCVNGASVSVDGKPTNWAVTSQGAAVNVRVTVTK
jgi:hypothetical protein